MTDVIIIGGGVIGCSIARELSRYQLEVVLLEANLDICEGTSKANSGIVHAGYDARPGTKKAKMNLLGNQMMSQVCKELDVPFQQDGSLVLASGNEEVEILNRLKEQGQENGVAGLEIIDRMRLLELEPEVAGEVSAALFAPTGGIVCPFELTLGMAENAYDNGVQFQLGERVVSVNWDGDGYQVDTEKGTYLARAVVNASGVYGQVIHQMVSQVPMKIIPRKGEYLLLDSAIGQEIHHTLFQVPTKMGKGVLVTPTTSKNVLLGPTAMDTEDYEDCATTEWGMGQIHKLVNRSIAFAWERSVITSFAGLRAHEEKGDFIMGEVSDAPYFFNAVGIESPGLTAAPAIGCTLADEVAKKLGAEKKEAFQPIRKRIHPFLTLTLAEQEEKRKGHPEYGEIVCRCEQITQGDILEAIHRPLGATTIDGIKRRTRAGMGRCQSGFCLPKTLEILSKETAIPKEEIRKNTKESYLLLEELKRRRP